MIVLPQPQGPVPEAFDLFDSAAATDAGRVRRENEDSCLARPDAGIWAVADGMGGHSAGALASAIVIEELRAIGAAGSAADLLALCEARVLAANARLRELARSRGVGVVGATLAVLLAHGTDYACVWSGDSRVYRIRGGAILQLSRDHTEVQDLIASGVLRPERAASWPRRNIVTRAIGVHDTPELDIEQGGLEIGDVFVLCSDGLTEHVEDREILSAVVGEASAQAACDRLLALTLERGAQDNVTVVVVRYGPSGSRAA